MQSSTEYLHVVGDLVEVLNSERRAIAHATGGLSQYITDLHTQQQGVINKSLQAIEQQNSHVVSQFVRHLDTTALTLREHLNAQPSLSKTLQELGELPKSIDHLGQLIQHLAETTRVLREELNAHSGLSETLQEELAKLPKVIEQLSRAVKAQTPAQTGRDRQTYLKVTQGKRTKATPRPIPQRRSKYQSLLLRCLGSKVQG